VKGVENLKRESIQSYCTLKKLLPFSRQGRPPPSFLAVPGG